MWELRMAVPHDKLEPNTLDFASIGKQRRTLTSLKTNHSQSLVLEIQLTN
eukprot:CAMPEP_0115714720 /NCGR_PEP_ID=MMETSP0272-20121206/75393_1 /TAXON_ID=71861 /ORGANISM="Scrippsiella trochoidea, Strain CCMP3099" /LENGTH=49 /DNA_ID=CAMNT_0003156891 /DNA_START=57 /DNA_END=206 /DNA_ORIENTATION=+